MLSRPETLHVLATLAVAGICLQQYIINTHTMLCSKLFELTKLLSLRSPTCTYSTLCWLAIANPTIKWFVFAHPETQSSHNGMG